MNGSAENPVRANGCASHEEILQYAKMLAEALPLRVLRHMKMVIEERWDGQVAVNFHRGVFMAHDLKGHFPVLHRAPAGEPQENR